MFMFILSGGVCNAQTQVDIAAPSDSSKVDYNRLALVGAGAVVTLVGAHIYQRDAWWQSGRSFFRFQNDWQYALNIDKIGHTEGGYFEAKIFKSLASWIGFNDRASTFYGSIFGMLYQLYVEIEDGYHSQYGFSPGDAFADIIGASIPIAQEAVPELRNFGIKFSYWPSAKILDEWRRHQYHTFIDDYEGQTFWINMDPHFFLGENGKVIPAWLGIAVGAGIRNYDVPGATRRRIYLAFDYNFSKIETSSAFLHTVLTALDFLHYPAPGIRLENNKISVGLF